MLVFPAAREAAKKGKSFEVPMLDETRLATVHQDDLADLYLRVAERVGSIFTDTTTGVC